MLRLLPAAGRAFSRLPRLKNGRLPHAISFAYVPCRWASSSKPVVGAIVVTGPMSLRQLSGKLGMKLDDLQKVVVDLGVDLAERPSNTVLDPFVIEQIAEELKVTATMKIKTGETSSVGTWESRPPVVAVMGHVDHGKTTLLDALRNANVAAGEAGGITQHVGAFDVDIGDGKLVTFLDTPGHAAFSGARTRGAAITDIVVLVVAADDGVQPQTVDAIRAARASSVPVVVAVTKMDKHGADPEKVRMGLLDHRIVVEAVGGDTQCIEVSATAAQQDPSAGNLRLLVEAISLQAELMELRARVDGPAQGAIIDSRLGRGTGPVATVLVRQGQLVPGAVIVAGHTYARVRTLVDMKGAEIASCPAGRAAEVTGFRDVAEPGETFQQVEDETVARTALDQRAGIEAAKERLEASATPAAKTPLKYENAMKARWARRRQQGGVREEVTQEEVKRLATELSLVVKVDVAGSLDAIKSSLAALSAEAHGEARITVMHGSVGEVTMNDVVLAQEFNAHIVAFTAPVPPAVRDQARLTGVVVHEYNVIYTLLDDAREMLTDLLPPGERLQQTAAATVAMVFPYKTKSKRDDTNVGGCKVLDGTIKRGARAHVFRDDEKIFEGHVSELRHFKEEVPTAKAGGECGLVILGHRFQHGDKIICYDVEKVKRTLDDARQAAQTRKQQEKMLASQPVSAEPQQTPKSETMKRPASEAEEEEGEEEEEDEEQGDDNEDEAPGTAARPQRRRG